MFLPAPTLPTTPGICLIVCLGFAGHHNNNTLPQLGTVTAGEHLIPWAPLCLQGGAEGQSQAGAPPTLLGLESSTAWAWGHSGTGITGSNPHTTLMGAHGRALPPTPGTSQSLRKFSLPCSLRKCPIVQTEKALWLVGSCGGERLPAKSGCAPQSGGSLQKMKAEAICAKMAVEANGGVPTDYSSVRTARQCLI